MVKRIIRNKKGQVMIYIVWFIAAITILIIAAVIAPLGVSMNSEFYAIGEQLMLDGNETIGGIQDATVKAEIQGVITEALSAQQNNINVNADIFQYSWIFVLIIGALVLFIFSRRLIETGGGFV